MMQQFTLAIDAGTSRTAAAIARVSAEGTLLAHPLPLGRQCDSVPSTIYVGDGELLFGDAAERRGITDPERVVRQVKRRIGDDVPLTIGDRTFGSEELLALFAAWVVETVVEREGQRPSSTAFTVPVTWGPYRTRLVAQALERHGLGDVMLITEPEAAARHYASVRSLDPGGIVVVYDLGGGTFDVALLRATGNGDIEIIGEPAGLDDLGGADFDDAIVHHALRFADADVGALTSTDARISLASFRRECVDAKESLSFDSEATIPTMLGGTPKSVRVTREEFESMIEHHIERTLDVVADALDAAGVAIDDVDAILLTGGSSRIPRIAQLLSERFDRPLAIDADPKAIIALGAARASANARGMSASALEDSDTAAATSRDPVGAVDAVAVGPGSDHDGREAGAGNPRRRWYQRLPVGASTAAGVVALVGALTVPAVASLTAGQTAVGSSTTAGAGSSTGAGAAAALLPVATYDGSALAKAIDTATANAPSVREEVPPTNVAPVDDAPVQDRSSRTPPSRSISPAKPKGVPDRPPASTAPSRSDPVTPSDPSSPPTSSTPPLPAPSTTAPAEPTGDPVTPPTDPPADPPTDPPADPPADPPTDPGGPPATDPQPAPDQPPPAPDPLPADPPAEPPLPADPPAAG